MAAVSCTGAIESSHDRTGASGDHAGAGRPDQPGSMSGPSVAAPGGGSSKAVARPRPVARRLTKDEYGHTVRDVLGVDIGPDLAVLTDDRALEIFVNVADAQTVDPERALGFAKLGQLVANKLDLAAIGMKYAVCMSPAKDCQVAFVARMGLSLFRRPLRAEESAAFEKLFADVLAAGADYSRGARAVVEAMLSSPQFLYRLETERTGTPGLRPLNKYELATRISYLLWASAPDEALLQAAAAGSLATPQGRQDQVARMLRDDRARRVTARFVRDWLRTEDLPATAAPEIAALVALYQKHVWTDKAPLVELFGTTQGEPGRTGLLGQSAALMSMSSEGPGNIITRGLFLESRVLCHDPTHDPPEAIRGLIEQVAMSAPPNASDRQISEIRLGRPECGVCHQAFDPLAFGFEIFDVRGRSRTADEHGNNVRSDGWIPNAQSGGRVEYRNFEEYMGILARDPGVARCVARMHLASALGAALTTEHEPWAETLRRDHAQAGGDYRAMVAAIVKHELFATVVTE